MCNNTSECFNLLLLDRSQSIEVVHLSTNRCHSVQVPVKLGSVLMMSRDDWLISEAGSNRLVGQSGLYRSQLERSSSEFNYRIPLKYACCVTDFIGKIVDLKTPESQNQYHLLSCFYCWIIVYAFLAFCVLWARLIFSHRLHDNPSHMPATPHYTPLSYLLYTPITPLVIAPLHPITLLCHSSLTPHCTPLSYLLYTPSHPFVMAHLHPITPLCHSPLCSHVIPLYTTWHSLVIHPLHPMTLPLCIPLTPPCHTPITLPCYTNIPQPFQCHHSHVTPLSHPVTPLSHHCHTPVTPLSHPCHTPVKPVKHTHYSSQYTFNKPQHYTPVTPRLHTAYCTLITHQHTPVTSTPIIPIHCQSPTDLHDCTIRNSSKQCLYLFASYYVTRMIHTLNLYPSGSTCCTMARRVTWNTT